LSSDHDLWSPSANLCSHQGIHNRLRFVDGNLDEGIIFKNVNHADGFSINAGFICNRSNKITWAQVVPTTDVNEESRHSLLRLGAINHHLVGGNLLIYVSALPKHL
jgi:allantoicase